MSSQYVTFIDNVRSEGSSASVSAKARRARINFCAYIKCRAKHGHARFSLSTSPRTRTYRFSQSIPGTRNAVEREGFGVGVIDRELLPSKIAVGHGLAQTTVNIKVAGDDLLTHLVGFNKSLGVRVVANQDTKGQRPEVPLLQCL